MNNLKIGSVRIGLGIVVVLAAFILVTWLKPKSPSSEQFTPEQIVDASSQTKQTNSQIPPSSTPIPKLSTYKLLSVPFFSQAPNANWDDPRQQDVCEDASLLMAWLWVNGKTNMTKNQAEAEIIAMSEFELTQYGNFYDLNAQDTAKLMRDYYGYDKTRVQEKITVEDIKSELRKGNLVLTPANGQRLGNPNFTNGGPLTHMVVVRGFDDERQEFITNDPGTRNGNLYRYNYQTFMNALVNYPTGYHEDQTGRPNAMIVVSK